MFLLLASRTREAYTVAEFGEAVKRLGISPQVARRFKRHLGSITDLDKYLLKAQAAEDQRKVPGAATTSERERRERAIEEMERINAEAERQVEAERLAKRGAKR